MRKFLAKLFAGLSRLREITFKGLFRVWFRYDIFISYSHSDAKGYAANLKKQLSNLDFACFIDEEESPAGVSLKPTVEKALTKSAVLVLLGTSRALTRPYIALEVEKFAPTERAIIPINIADALLRDDDQILSKLPWKVIKDRDLIWLDETEDAFQKKAPSPQIADGIDKLFKYTRRNARVRAEIILTAVVVLVAALGAGYVIKGKTEELAQQSSRNEELRKEASRLEGVANDARQRAETQQEIASRATTEAEKQLKAARDAKEEAKRQEEIARQARQEALRQQELATEATAEARRQQQLARAAELEAKKQQTIARAREFANQAERDRGNSSAQTLSDSTSSAIRSIKLHPTLEGDLALRNNLNLIPSLTNEKSYQGQFVSAALSPNATAVAFLTPDNQVEVRRADNKIAHRSRPAHHHYIALSNDGKYVATAGGNTALVQNTATNETWNITIDDESQIRALALSANGKYLAMINSADEGMWVDVWEKESGKMIGRPSHGDIKISVLRDVAFSPDQDEYLAVGGQEKHRGSINGFLLAWLIKKEQGDARSNSRSKEKDAQEMPKYRFEPRFSLRQSGEVERIAITGDDYLLTANPYTALVWEKTRLGDYRQVGRVPLALPLALAFDKDASHVHIVSEAAGTIESTVPRPADKAEKIWEASGRREKTRAILSNEILAVSFRPNSDLMTTLSQTYSELDENGLRVWGAKDAEEKKQEEIQFTLEGQYDFSGDGRYLAATDKQGLVQIWDLTNKMKVGNGLSVSGLNSIETIRLSYDGKFLALAGNGQSSDALLFVYQRFDKDYRALSPPFRLPQDTRLDALALSPDGNLVATATSDYKVHFWSVKTGREAILKSLLQGGDVHAILFSPTGRFIAALSSGRTMVWELSTGKTVVSIDSGYGWQTSVANHTIAFSHDERYIAVGTYTGDARVWDLFSGQELMRLQHDDPVVSISFSQDGKYLATATAVIDPDTSRKQSYVLRAWLVQPLDLIAETCQRLPSACAERAGN